MASNVIAQGMVRDLVNQFSDTYCFYRELIQNAIDAGSNRIDVTTEYLPAPGGPGTAVLRVEDDGSGMDESIIDNFLLVLFKSSKENDLTKIGKFGVGFLSVFAPKPYLVRVYTAKNLESWRLDFPDWRSYRKYKMPSLRDGTLVEVHKRATRAEYDEISARSLETVRYWCRHADTRIYFTEKTAGAPPLQVNEAFTLPGGESLRHTEEGTEIVMSFSPMGGLWGLTSEEGRELRGRYPGVDFDAEPFYGFYNRGLTLKEGRRIIVPGVELKIKSRYLEHTITRDNVLEDENYGKAMAIVKRVAERELPGRVRAELESVAARLSEPAVQAEPAALRALEYEWLRRKRFLQLLCAPFLAKFRHDFKEWRILPTVTGTAVSLRDLAAAFKRLGKAANRFHPGQKFYFAAPGADAVTAALAALGMPVLLESRACRFDDFAGWADSELVPVKIGDLILSEEIPAGELGPAMAAFLKTAAQAGEALGRDYAVLYPARFTGPAGAPGEARPFSFLAAPYGPAWREEGWALRGETKLHPVVNCAHPFINVLAELHASRPGFAAFLLLKAMLLHMDCGFSPEACGSSNLTRRRERKLLRAALKLDEAAGRARG